jgi:hypothetical protein
LLENGAAVNGPFNGEVRLAHFFGVSP